MFHTRKTNIPSLQILFNNIRLHSYELSDKKGAEEARSETVQYQIS